MGIDTDRDRLLQAETLARFRHEFELTELVTVYLSDIDDSHNHGIFSTLIPSDQIEQTLSSVFWDSSFGDGMPSAVVYHEDAKKRVEYLRYGVGGGFEPLIISREFHGMRNDYIEISEEFRLFHRLYHDRKTDEYIKIEDDGREELVAVIKPNRAQVRLKEIRQFLAVKDMCLSIQFDCREHSRHLLDELGLREDGTRQRDALVCWERRYGDFGTASDHRAFGRLVGKRLVAPLPKSKSGFWGFADEPEEEHVEFIIGVDENGDESTYTSNPDALANYFGANPEAPHYLTPVHFRKEVLDKYYQQPSKYSVGDSFLHCGSLWSMQLDNNHDDRVCAWLGDLGRDLPYREQLYWRGYNIPPEGSLSKTFFSRQILNRPTDSDRPEHLFKQSYHTLQRACEKRLGWQLLLRLAPDDEYHFERLRVPATDEQSQFDDLVLSLTKILIDSLNERCINKLIPVEQRGDSNGGIVRLEAALASCGVGDAADCISFLRNLQQLRSTGTAHRKGAKYRRVAVDFGVEDQSLRAVFAEILRQAVGVLDYLTGVVSSNRMRPS